MMGGYLILNSGFEMVRIPPVGAGIPVGELALVLSLLILNPLYILPRMSRQVWLFPILVWWMLTLPRSLFDTTVGGVWSFRDASQAIESLYLIIGFGLVNSVDNVRYFFSWLRKILLFMVFYGLLYPFCTTLREFSPSIPGVSSGSTKLLFSTTNTPTLALLSAAWLLLEGGRTKKSAPWNYLFVAFLVAYIAAFSQGRTLYMQILGLGVVFFFIRRKAAVRWYSIVVIGCLIIAIVGVSGVGLKGRLGEKVSLDFMVRHLESSSGASGEGTGASAGGVALRIGWWHHIYMQMKQSPYNETFGLGYGMPLTDFRSNTGAAVREPHNSYISVWARLGATGAVFWALMQIVLYRAWWRSYSLVKRMGWIHAQNNLLLLLIFCFFTLIGAVGEDVLEKPFSAIPYYLFFGVVLRYGILLREHAELQH
jgi:O-antigen ligase